MDLQTSHRPEIGSYRYVVRHIPGPGWIADKPAAEQPEIMGHRDYLIELAEAGKTEFGCTYQGSGDDLGGGFVMFAAHVDADEARQLAEGDPAVVVGTIIVKVNAWKINQIWTD